MLGVCFLSTGLRLPCRWMSQGFSDAILILSPLFVLYIRGTLIKLVYKASCGGEVELMFIEFERRSVDECFEFVRAEGLLRYNGTMLLASPACNPKLIEASQEKHMGAIDGVDSPS